MRQPEKLHKQVALVDVVQRNALSPLVGSKPSLIKHLAVSHPDAF